MNIYREYLSTVYSYIMVKNKKKKHIPSLISKVSRYKSSKRISAKASLTSKPYTKACTKSAAFCMLFGSVVSFPVYKKKNQVIF